MLFKVWMDARVSVRTQLFLRRCKEERTIITVWAMLPSVTSASSVTMETIITSSHTAYLKGLIVLCTTAHFSLSQSIMRLIYLTAWYAWTAYCRAKSVSLLLPGSTLQLWKRICLHGNVLILKPLKGKHSSGCSACGLWGQICVSKSQLGGKRVLSYMKSISFPYVTCWTNDSRTCRAGAGGDSASVIHTKYLSASSSNMQVCRAPESWRVGGLCTLLSLKMAAFSYHTENMPHTQKRIPAGSLNPCLTNTFEITSMIEQTLLQ